MAPRDNLFGRGVRMVVQILVCPRLARMTSPAPFLRYRTDLVADLMPGLKRCILADPKGVIGLAKPEAARSHEIIVRRAVVFLRNLQNEPMIPLEQLLLGAIAPGFRQAKQILHLAGIRNRTTPAISS